MKIPKLNIFLTVILMAFAFSFLAVGCQTSATCGNEVQIVKTPRFKSSGKSCGNERQVVRQPRVRRGSPACGNQKVVAKKKRKVRKKDMALFGKEGNPYNSRGKRK